MNKTNSKIIDEWNAKYPVGTPVKYKNVIDDDFPWKYSTTRTLATISNKRSVIWMNNVTGYYLLTHVFPLTPEEIKEQQKLEKELRERANRNCVEL